MISQEIYESPKIFAERFRTIERVFAWEDKFKRLLLRFEVDSKPLRHEDNSIYDDQFATLLLAFAFV